MSETSRFDLLVVGGGINGTGIARDAAGRGLSVLLIEQDDLAAGTSSRSSKMIHGGLRYLENFQFRLVREALKEREVLQKIAPQIVRPLNFILPYVAAMRPKWLLKIGLFIYDHLGGASSLPRSGSVDLTAAREGQPLLPSYTEGFHYSDCWVEDMRLVVLNAVDASHRGAVIRTRTRLEAATVQHGIWQARLVDTRTGAHEEVSARFMVNAAGPWVADVLTLCRTPDVQPAGKSAIRLVKGSHIVVPRIYEGDWAYLCQNEDGRVIFFLPFEQDFTLIGTTDTPFTGNPATVTCSEEEEAYLLGVAARFFKKPPAAMTVVHRFAGVRSLYDDGSRTPQDVTRDYVLKLETHPAPLLSLYGGKITTFRRLAEQAVEKILGCLAENDPRRKASPWTASTPLPGGNLAQGLPAFISESTRRWPWVPAPLLARWCRQYGTRIALLLGDAHSPKDMGAELAPGLYQIEADYLRAHEFAETLEDMLWRRTRLGLRLSTTP
jgi:glycerol-3-phosphate dehydrogenase